MVALLFRRTVSGIACEQVERDEAYGRNNQLVDDEGQGALVSVEKGVLDEDGSLL